MAAGSGGNAGGGFGRVIAFPGRPPAQVAFERDELQRILNLYGRMVSAGEWRD